MAKNVATHVSRKENLISLHKPQHYADITVYNAISYDFVRVMARTTTLAETAWPKEEQRKPATP